MAQENTNATEGYQMKTGWGTIAMLISATGMGLVPLFSRWARERICSMAPWA